MRKRTLLAKSKVRVRSMLSALGTRGVFETEQGTATPVIYPFLIVFGFVSNGSVNGETDPRQSENNTTDFYFITTS